MYKQITPQELESLRSALHYDPETGNFSWKTRQQGRCINKCGTANSEGYLSIQLNYYPYLLHRLAWIFTHSVNPLGQIDHINGITSDNCITNLRDVSPSHNKQNLRKPRSDNTSGYLGVSFNKQRRLYMAQITVGKHGDVGYINKVSKGYVNAADAYVWYLEQKRLLHPGNML